MSNLLLLYVRFIVGNGFNIEQLAFVVIGFAIEDGYLKIEDGYLKIFHFTST